MATRGVEDPLIASPDGPPTEKVAATQDASEGRSGTPAARASRIAVGAPNVALRTLAALGVVAALVFARAVFVPVALAALVAFLLSPVANLLERLRFPRAFAATVSVLALAVAALAVMWETGSQAVDLARRLPEYRKTLDTKLSSLTSGGVLSPIREAVTRLKELGGHWTSEAADDAGRGPTQVAPQSPSPRVAVQPVRVVPDERTTFDVVGDVAGSVLGPLGVAAIVVLLSIFFLSYRASVRERLLALGSARRIGMTSQAMEEAGRRVARYLIANLAVNVLYGTAVGVAVSIIGVPNAWLWGLLCALFRLVPYVGTWIGAVLPLAVSIAVFDGWGRTAAVFACILGIDVVVGNVVEPVVYGHRTGLSPLAVVLATVFWTWVWGIPGLLLAIPLTLCFAVVGRYVPGFGVFHVLLGDEPMLDPAERAYERLMAFDAVGAGRVVAEVSARLGGPAADDAVLLPALRRAERDRREGQLDEERYLAICDGVREALVEREVAEPAVASVGAVLCLPAFAESDRVACEMLARHLATGVAVEIGPNATTISDLLGRSAPDGASTVCVVALPPYAGLRVRYGIRRAHSQAPDALLVGVVLDPEADRSRVEASLRQAGAAETRFSLAELVASLAPGPLPPPSPLLPSATDATSRSPAPLAGARTCA